MKMKDYPNVSIIIPVRNEEKYIEECLKQLLNQIYPEDKIEIIVIDGMSEDGTREVVKRFEVHGSKFEVQGSENEKPVIRLIDNPNGQRASALNIGIREAKGDVIMRIDARTIIPPDYIEKCVNTLIETGVDNVGGVQKPVTMLEVRGERFETGKSQPQTLTLNPHALTQEAIGIALSHPFGVGDAQFRLGKKSGYVDTVYLGCFRKEIFDKVGLFDEESAVVSEDADMNQRIRDAGGKVYLNKDIVAFYYPRDNFKDLWKLYFRYGGAKAGNLIKRGRLTAWRQFVPPAFLLSLVLFPILGIFNKLFFYLWLLIVGSYICVDLLVSIYLSFKHKISSFMPQTLDVEHRTSDRGSSKPSLLWRLLLVFPVIHFSWAMGFWRRLLQRPKLGEYWGY